VTDIDGLPEPVWLPEEAWLAELERLAVTLGVAP